MLTVYVDPGRLEDGSGPKCGPLVLTVDHSVLLSSVVEDYVNWRMQKGIGLKHSGLEDM